MRMTVLEMPLPPVPAAPAPAPEAPASAVIQLDLALVAEIRNAVATELSAIRRQETIAEELSDADEEARAQSIIWEQLDQLARRRNLNGQQSLTPQIEEAVARRVKADLFGLGGFEDYVFDPMVENIFVNGHDRVFVNRKGAAHTEQVGPIAESDQAVIQLINRWAARLGRTERRFDVANPRLDMRLPGGHRLHAIMEVTERPTISIRCPYPKQVRLADQLNFGTVDERMASVLRAAVKSRCNIIVAGGTGTGKTTLLKALLHEAPPHERIITIEDTIELNLSRWVENHPNVVEMETRQANLEGVGELTMMDLTRECLRMSPDRVVLGEVRGAEALYMLKAMSQGNDGSMCTLHADSAFGVADRIRGYVAEGTTGLPMPVIDGFFRNAVDLIVHLKVLPDRRRVVSSIVEVQKDTEDGVRYNELFEFNYDGPATPGVVPSPKLLEKLRQGGLEVHPW